eukprot:jgi/Tetstr1/448504/TSEL_035770.t1
MPLGRRTDCGDARYSGVEVDFESDLVQSLQDATLCGIDFLLVPLVPQRYRKRLPEQTPSGERPTPLTRSDLILSSAQWSSQILGSVSSWIDLDAADAEYRLDSEAALKQELAWAAHLSLQAVVLPVPQRPMAAINFTRVVNQSLNSLSNMGLWVRVPLVSPEAEQRELAEAAGGDQHPGTPAEGDDDSWKWWHQMRCLCESHSLLGAVLQLSETIPPPESWRRWLGEPVKAVVVPTSVFTTNKRGFPTLPRSHQDLLVCFFQHNIQVILSGEPHHALNVSDSGGAPPSDPTPGEASGPSLHADPGASHPLRVYWEYLSYLFRKMPGQSEQEIAEMSYRDYLQAPLQPLQDNLESQTYETFERDTVKYTTYQEAVYKALLDRPAEEDVCVLMVVGAGRGPLVRASLQAAKRAKKQLRVYAVEKNPNAVVTLQNLVLHEGWESTVTVVHTDMRSWNAPEKADILVSELLGSFGDNELSPECLDGAQEFLKDGGISIPESYTSFLTPITTNKLYSDVKAYGDLQHFETPYVVKFHKIHPLADTQEVFTFTHPNRSDHIDNTRYKKMAFERAADAPAVAMHGLAGYFESVLYGDVTLSTHPPTHTPNMFSWFPIFFPFRKPVLVPSGSKIEVHMWRCVAAHKVWYEWATSSPETLPVHNVNGRSYYVGL